MINIITGFLIAIILLLAFGGLVWAFKEFRKIGEAKEYVARISYASDLTCDDIPEMRELGREDLTMLAREFRISENELIKTKLIAEKMQMTAESIYYRAIAKKDLEQADADIWLEKISVAIKQNFS